MLLVVFFLLITQLIQCIRRKKAVAYTSDSTSNLAKNVGSSTITPRKEKIEHTTRLSVHGADPSDILGGGNESNFESPSAPNRGSNLITAAALANSERTCIEKSKKVVQSKASQKPIKVIRHDQKVVQPTQRETQRETVKEESPKSKPEVDKTQISQNPPQAPSFKAAQTGTSKRPNAKVDSQIDVTQLSQNSAKPTKESYWVKPYHTAEEPTKE